MALPSQHFKPTCGFWRTEHNKTEWCETDKYGNFIKAYEPLELFNIMREARFKIVLIKEISDSEAWSKKTKKFFAQDVEIHLAENVDDSIVIKFEPSSKKFYLSDLKPLGQTFAIPLEQQPDNILIINKSEIYPITNTQAKSFLAQWGYGFGKCTTDENGHVTEYITTV